MDLSNGKFVGNGITAGELYLPKLGLSQKVEVNNLAFANVIQNL